MDSLYKFEPHNDMDIDNQDDNAQCPFGGNDNFTCFGPTATSVLNEVVTVSHDSALGSSVSGFSQWSLQDNNMCISTTSRTLEDVIVMDEVEDTASPVRRPLQDISNDTPAKHKRFNRLPSTSSSMSLNKVVVKKKAEARFLKRPSPKLPDSVKPSDKLVSRSMVNMTRQGKCVSPESIQSYSLRCVPRPQVASSAFKSIDGQALAALIKELGNEKFLESFMLIDCRYPFEYEGGHIVNAVNMFEFANVRQYLFKEEDGTCSAIQSKIPIFYCEFSQARGPKMASTLRKFDRHVNTNNYPHLDYPEIYILESGYQGFFKMEEFKGLCTPCHYIRMHDKAFANELKGFNHHKKGATHRL
ncbi:unnamed protein product [Bursaphelenchus okinawaensis]|uniref:protein-tyrosine-phosphatase n=1 Tax=Bursaphelenchus okinawaensis TaxID=465554 RepID=A0A811L9B6_9BILA|nr:unnamed protein product [Bursaphelenchus okinawaensis]CAG9120221.1 unnamed protein product [Bursaphelenchus okinawaensis]